MPKKTTFLIGLIFLTALGYLIFTSLINQERRVFLPQPAPQTPSTSDTAKTTTQVNIFLVALEDQGESGKQIGCEDSLIAVERDVQETTTPMRTALEELLSIKDQFYGQSGLYNSIYQSQLEVESVSLAQGKATIKLSGTYKLGGVCDNPRFQAQIEETALQFPSVSEVSVFINEISLDTLLSGEGN